MVARPKVKKPDTSGVIAELRRMLQAGKSDEMLAMVQAVLEQMAAQNAELGWRLQTALGQLYRKKSEKISPEQLSLFLSRLTAEQAAKANVELPEEPKTQTSESPAPSDEPVNTPKHPRTPHRKPLPEHLRRDVRSIPVPPAQCQCATCGATKEPMGYEVREILEFKPGEFFVIEERLEKRACKRCQEGVVTAEGTGKPIEGGRPGPGLLAQIVTAKCREAMPLYRQSQSYQRSGITLSPSTLGDWFAAAADLYEPVHDCAMAATLASYLLSLDDTGMPVLDRETPNGIKRGHIWTYLGDQDRIAFCDYTPNWKKEGPCSVLEKFTGKVVQGDGYAGIDAFFEKLDAAIRAGCMDHCRRRFVKALESGDTRAAVVIAIIGKLYEIEAKARSDCADLQELARRRDTLSREVTNQLGRAIADLTNNSLPKSPMGKACKYAVRQWSTLMAFLEDPRIPLSNAHVERQQRRTALVRKNALFAGSDDGARRLAILMTAVINCELHDVPLFEYLRDVFAKISNGWPKSRITELLPAAWAAAQAAQAKSDTTTG